MRISKRRIALAATLGAALCAALVVWYLRGRNSPPIPPRGGQVVAQVFSIDTPLFLQGDPQWKDDTIGGSGERLESVGCTVASLAMALCAHGFESTPKALNQWLKDHEGYTFRGWLKWDSVARFTKDRVNVVIPPRPTHAHIDQALRSGNPVLVKVFINKIIPHWVLLVGKRGDEYLMRDPLSDSPDLQVLSRYNSDIFGVRIVAAQEGAAGF